MIDRARTDVFAREVMPRASCVLGREKKKGKFEDITNRWDDRKKQQKGSPVSSGDYGSISRLKCIFIFSKYTSLRPPSTNVTRKKRSSDGGG